MKWSWKLCQITGISIYVHSTFLILVAWVAFDSFLKERSFVAAIGGVLFILTLFGIVVLHELGHALAARRYGIPTRDIILLPIGGVARLERMPEDPKQELIVALAGPAVNVVLAIVLSIAFIIVSRASIPIDEGLLLQLIGINVTLLVFNLLPAFPMDGGRVLRAVLAMRTDNYLRATQIAATIGKVMAVLFGLIGVFVFKTPFLILIAFFVWFGATQETAMAKAKFAPRWIPNNRVMITLSPDDLLEQVAENILAGFQQDFPVVADGHLIGVLTRSELLKALTQEGPKTRVGELIYTTLDRPPI